MNVYIATSNDPFYNLATENWLFYNVLKDKPILYLWQNSPSIIIGRSQNPWRECDIDILNDHKIPIVRRQSGGGAVYHDLGNLNYTIMTKSENCDKKGNLMLILSILKVYGIVGYISPYNDIVVQYKGVERKISGNAFRRVKDRSFHHGTLLIDVNIEKIKKYLHHSIDPALVTKGVHSRRSNIISLNCLNRNITVASILNCFLMENKEHVHYLPKSTRNQIILNEVKKLRSWHWRFGKTLPFTHNFFFKGDKISLEIKNGSVSCYKSTDYRYLHLENCCKESKLTYTKEKFRRIYKKVKSYNSLSREKELLKYLCYVIPHKNLPI